MNQRWRQRPGRGGAGRAWAVLAVMGACAAMAPKARAQVLVERVRTFAVGQTLGDVEDPPRVFTGAVSGTGIVSLTGVKVGLRLVGAPEGFASEMVVMLTKDLQRTSVLLNQVGVGVGSGLGAVVGYGYNGWDVTFADGAAAGDVHGLSLSNGVLTGEVAPDGRVSPTDTARPGMLAVMIGLPGDGVWHLSVADLGVGGTMRLESWSVTLTGVVPEPGASAVAMGMGLVAFAGWLCWRRR